MTLYNYWIIIYRRRLLVLTTVVAAAAVAWVASQRLPPVYQAVAEFYVTDPPPTAPLLSTAGGAGVPQPSLPVILQERERSYVGMLESAVIQRRVHRAVPGKNITRLSRDVDVNSTKYHLIRIRVRDTDPEIAAAIANAYPVALNGMLADISQERTARNAAVLRAAAADRRRGLMEARQELKAFLLESGTADVQRDTEELAKRRAAAEADHERAVAALKQVQSRIQVAELRLQREATVFVTSQSASSSPLAQNLHKDISDVQAELAAARTRYTDKHPQVRRLLERLENKKQDLAREIDRSVSGDAKLPDSLYERLRGQVAELNVERAALEADVAAKTVTLGALVQRSHLAPPVRLREEELRAEIASLQRMADAVTLGYEEARAQAAVRPDEVVILQQAAAPIEPLFPLPLINAAVAALLGLIAGIYLAFFAEYLSWVNRRVAWETP